MERLGGSLKISVFEWGAAHTQCKGWGAAGRFGILTGEKLIQSAEAGGQLDDLDFCLGGRDPVK